MSKPFPYEIPTFVYVSGSTPYVFNMELKAEALKVAGILEHVASVFAAHGVSILQVFVAFGEISRLVVFADVKEKRLADQIARELRKVPTVLDVSYLEPVADGFAYCHLCFPPTVRGLRAIILSKQVYEGFFREGWSRFGTGFPILLYMLGFKAGYLAYEVHSKIAGGDAQAAVKVAEAFFQVLGYGRLEMRSIDDRRKEAICRVYDSFECDLFKGVGEIRAGFVRGLIGGWLAARWGVPEAEKVVAREEKCVAKATPTASFESG